MYDFSKWTDATAALPWGAQRVILDTLKCVADGQVKGLTYNADYYGGNPCLINAAAHMLSKVQGEGGHGKPSNAFPDVVAEFDRINRHLESVGVNKEHNTVSPAAAEVLVHHFGPLRKEELSDQVNEATKVEAFANVAYREPTDEEIARDWMTALNSTDACPTEEEQEFQREASELDPDTYADYVKAKERNL